MPSPRFRGSHAASFRQSAGRIDLKSRRSRLAELDARLLKDIALSRPTTASRIVGAAELETRSCSTRSNPCCSAAPAADRRGLLQRDDPLLDDIGVTRDDLMLMLAGRSTTLISLGRSRE